MQEINQQNEGQEKPVAANLSFEEFSNGPVWQTYLDNKGVARSTRRAYSSNMRRHILPKIGSMLLAEIEPADIGELLGEVRTSVGASKSVLNIYGQLKTMFAVAEENDLIEKSPVRKSLHRPKHDSEEKPAWSAEQVRAILENVPDVWAAFFVCLALTTVRIGELLALTWQDVDLDGRKIRVVKSLDRGVVIPRTKNRTRQTRHIPDVLLAYLRRHREISKFVGQDDFVFCKLDGSACDPDHVRESVLYPALDRAGIEKVPRSSGFHAFRHAGSSIINEVTGDLKLSQIQLGHKRISTTANIYTHSNMRQVERAGEVLAKEIAHQMPTKSLVGCPPEEKGIADAS